MNHLRESLDSREKKAIQPMIAQTTVTTVKMEKKIGGLEKK